MEQTVTIELTECNWPVGRYHYVDIICGEPIVTIRTFALKRTSTGRVTDFYVHALCAKHLHAHLTDLAQARKVFENDDSYLIQEQPCPN